MYNYLKPQLHTNDCPMGETRNQLRIHPRFSTINSLQKSDKQVNQSANFLVGNRFHATLRILSPTI